MPKKTFYRLNDVKRSHIEQKAMKVINYQGYDMTTIKDVVDAAGIPRGSFYQYFEGLSDLFNHLIHIIANRKMVYMDDLVKKLDTMPFLDLFPDLTKAGLTFAKNDKEAYKFGHHLYHSHSDEVLKMRNQMEKEGIAMMETYLLKDLEKGWLKSDVDIKMLAKLLYDFNARNLVYQFYREVPFNTMIERSNAFIKILTNGVKKEAVHES
jgi:AcrR family transcriptional regulator